MLSIYTLCLCTKREELINSKTLKPRLSLNSFCNMTHVIERMMQVLLLFADTLTGRCARTCQVLLTTGVYYFDRERNIRSAAYEWYKMLLHTVLYVGFMKYEHLPTNDNENDNLNDWIENKILVIELVSTWDFYQDYMKFKQIILHA